MTDTRWDKLLGVDHAVEGAPGLADGSRRRPAVPAECEASRPSQPRRSASAVGCDVSLSHLSRDAAPRRDRVAVLERPRTDFLGRSLGRRAWRRRCWCLPHLSRSPASSGSTRRTPRSDVLTEHVSELLLLGVGEIDLVAPAVKSELHGASRTCRDFGTAQVRVESCNRPGRHAVSINPRTTRRKSVAHANCCGARNHTRLHRSGPRAWPSSSADAVGHFGTAGCLPPHGRAYPTPL